MKKECSGIIAVFVSLSLLHSSAGKSVCLLFVGLFVCLFAISVGNT